jgi:hypothetical protein
MSVKNRTPNNVLESVKRHYGRNRDEILERKAQQYLQKNYKKIFFKPLQLLGLCKRDSQNIIKKAILDNLLVIDVGDNVIEDIDEFIGEYDFNNQYRHIEIDYKILDGERLQIKIPLHFLINK